MTTTNDRPARNPNVINVADALTIARLYQDTRERILAVVGPDDWSTAVPACPGWSVRDVVAHLTAIAEDWVNVASSVEPTERRRDGSTRLPDSTVVTWIRLWRCGTPQPHS